MAEREVFINVELGLTSEEFERELDSISRNIKPLEVPLEFNLDDFGNALKSIKSILDDVKSVTNSAKSAISSVSNPLKSVEDEIKNSFKSVLNSINSNIKSALNTAINVVISPIKETFKGVFTGLGMSISQSFSQSFSKNIETAFGKSSSDIGAASGAGVSKLITSLFNKQKSQDPTPDLYKAIFRETAKRSGAQVDEKLIPKLVPDLKEGAAAKYSAQSNSVHLNQADYKKLQSGKVDLVGVDTLAHEFRHALQLNFGQQGKGLGVNLLRGTKQELEQLQSQINESTRMAGKGQSQEVVNKIKQLETDAYVFASRTAQDIHNAITGVKASPKNQNIKNQIQQQQNQLVDEVTKSNTQALEQLTRQQMLQIAKSAGVKGTSRLSTGNLRSKLLQDVAPDELSFRIPTFSKPPAEVAKLASGLLSQPVDGVRKSVNNFSKQIQSTIKSNTKQVDSVPVRQALDDIQKARQTYAAALAQDVDKQTSDILKAAIARLGKQRIALQSRLTVANSKELNQVSRQFDPVGLKNIELFKAPNPSRGDSKTESELLDRARKRREERGKDAAQEASAAAKTMPAPFTKGQLSQLQELNNILLSLGKLPLAKSQTEFLGTGFLGTVFGSKDKAYKISNERINQKQLEERRINQEIASQSGLAPKIFNAAIANGKYFLETEKVVGASLNSVVKGMKKTGEKYNLSLLSETAALAATLHKSGVAHQDLHFGNIYKNKKSGALQALDFDSSVNLNRLSADDQEAAKAKDKRQLLRNLQRTYKGVLTPQQIQSEFLRLYQSEFDKATPANVTPKLGRKGLRDVGLLSSSFFNQLLDKTEDAFFGSPAFKGKKKVRARAEVAEAAGFLAAGGAMLAPQLAGVTALAPLIVPLTPIIATGVLVANVVTPIISAVADALKKIEPIKRRFEYAAGGAEGAAEQEQFARSISDKYQTSLLVSLEQYSQLLAAAKGTALEGQPIQDLFEGISAGTKALGTDAESSRLIFYAFGQMVSKGKISMEELRQQLGEKFSPAMEIFAKSLKVSVPELNALVEKGNLLSADVLPKVATQLKKEFGQAALSASGDFVSGLIRVDNAILKLQEGLARTFGPILTIATNTFAGLLNAVSQNIDGIVKVFNIALIGAAAQFLVGLTVILGNTKIIQTAVNAIAPAFARIFATLTPFFVGTFVDLIDDVLGAKFSVMDNMMQGVYNIVLSTITVIVKSVEKIQELFNTTISATQNTGNAFGAIIEPLKALKNAIPSTVVEFGALFLMLNQTYVLGKLALGPILTQLWGSIATLGVSFVTAARSGTVFQSVLGTLSAGLSSFQLQVSIATTALILFFAKADFADNLGKNIDVVTEKVTSNLDKLREAAEKTGKALDDLGKKPLTNNFKSKGFDLTFGLGEQFFGGKFTTDDVLKTAQNVSMDFDKGLLNQGLIGQKEYEENLSRNLNGYVTIAESQFSDTLVKLGNIGEKAQQSIDATFLLKPVEFRSSEAGKSLESIRKIDAEIKSLQSQRVDLASVEGSDQNPELKKQVADIDSQVKALLKTRATAVKPIQDLRTTVLSTSDALDQALSDINKADLPEQAKEQARTNLASVVSLYKKAKAELTNLNVIDLSPLGEDFKSVQTQIDKTDKSLERTLAKIKLGRAKDLGGIQQQLARGLISQPFFDATSMALEQSDLQAQSRNLSAFIGTRKSQLKQLMMAPEPTKDQRDAIEKNQKLVAEKSLELVQVQEQIGKKDVENQKRIKEQRLKDFEEAQSILENKQKSGNITEEQLLQDRLVIQQQKGDEQLADIKQRREKLGKTDREGLEALAVEEAQINANIKEAQKTAFDQRLALSQKRADEESAIAQSSKAKGLITETEFNQQQYDIRNKYLDDQLAVLKVKSQFTAKTDIDGQNLIKTEEAKILQQRIDARKAFVDAQLAQLEREQQKATDLTTLATREREIELQRLVNARVIKQEDVQAETLKVTRTGIEKELELERNKLQQLEAFPRYDDPVEEEGRQTKIRASRIRTSDLQLQLLQNEKSQQEAVYAAYSRAVDRVTGAIANRATAATQSFNSELLANSAIEKSLSFQNQLLDAQKNLRSALSSYVDAEFQILQETAKTDREKKKLAEAVANIKLQSARLQAESDRQSLELQIQQTDQAQRRLEVENAIAQIRNRADTAKSQAEYAKVSADPNTTPEQKEAARLGIVATMAEGEGLQQQSEFLMGQRATNVQTNQLRRQTQDLQSGANITRAEFEAANAIASKGERRRALRNLRDRANQRVFGTSDRSEASSRLSSFNSANRGQAITPLEQYRANIVQNRIAPALPTIELPKVTPMLDKTVSSLGTAVDSLVQLVQQKLSTPATVTIATPINNYFPTTPNPKDVASGNTQAARKELYDLGMLIQRSR